MRSVAAHRTALAVLRLVEAGDVQGARWLVESLDVEQLRAVLLAQTANVSGLLAGQFVEVAESRLPLLAALHGKTREQVVDDYLESLIVLHALQEVREE